MSLADGTAVCSHNVCNMFTLPYRVSYPCSVVKYRNTWLT